MSLTINSKPSDFSIRQDCYLSAFKQIFQKVNEVAKLIFKSIIFQASILFFFTFSQAASFIVFGSLIYLLSSIISSVVLTILIKRKFSAFIYEISTADGYIRQFISKKRWPWFNQITENIYLGALPLKNLDHEKIFKEKNITSILSLIETKDTRRKTIFTTPIDISYWRKNNYSHLQISTKDLYPLTFKDLHKAADFIHQNVLNNKKIYVHCTAGRSRSAMGVIAYLVKYKKMSLNEALRFVKSKRSVLYINLAQRKCLIQHFK